MILLGVAHALAAQPAPPGEPAPEVGAVEEESMQPEVIIRRRGEQVIEEYRIGGRTYMIKVVPPIGPPYYLLDTNGDGVMDVKRSDLEEGVRIHQWRILEW